MIYSYPAWDSAIFTEWRRWNDQCNREWSLTASEAKRSVERIAEALYDHQGGSVVGHMIIQNDLFEIEQEEQSLKDMDL